MLLYIRFLISRQMTANGQLPVTPSVSIVLVAVGEIIGLHVSSIHFFLFPCLSYIFIAPHSFCSSHGFLPLVSNLFLWITFPVFSVSIGIDWTRSRWVFCAETELYN